MATSRNDAIFPQNNGICSSETSSITIDVCD